MTQRKKNNQPVIKDVKYTAALTRLGGKRATFFVKILDTLCHVLNTLNSLHRQLLQNRKEIRRLQENTQQMTDLLNRIMQEVTRK